MYTSCTHICIRHMFTNIDDSNVDCVVRTYTMRYTTNTMKQLNSILLVASAMLFDKFDKYVKSNYFIFP